MRYFIGWFNRDLDSHLTHEQKLEIYGISKSASPEFDDIGPAYQRLMNYHAAHDIGHILQSMALVGCSSFATWNAKSSDSLLIVGRNFDFYVGDDFAVNKIVFFCKPDKGYRFMMVTWGGMTGVVSGMNMEGLTVTINSAKSSIPLGSATPVSLVAREILQYAATIEEAVAIARKRSISVSESFLIASSRDNKAVIIQKVPGRDDVYATDDDQIICTNHYQGSDLGNDEINMQQLKESASGYRYNRLKELLAGVERNTPEITASILRDQLGLNNKFIGYGNEKAVNQLISHHSIIFEPAKHIVYVSSNPWQLGKYVAYNLDKIFQMNGLEHNYEICDSIHNIEPDTFYNSGKYKNYQKFRLMRGLMEKSDTINVAEFIKLNPEYYHTYVISGDYEFRKKKYANALKYYNTALTKEIATIREKNYISEQILLCREELKK